MRNLLLCVYRTKRVLSALSLYTHVDCQQVQSDVNHRNKIKQKPLPDIISVITRTASVEYEYTYVLYIEPEIKCSNQIAFELVGPTSTYIPAGALAQAVGLLYGRGVVGITCIAPEDEKTSRLGRNRASFNEF